MVNVSIIIVNYRSEKMVRYCVENIRSLNVKIPHEIIVVNNDIPEAVSSVVPYLKGATVVQSEKNVGMGAGNNTGFTHAFGELFLVINPDVVVLPGAIEAMVEWFKTHPESVIAGPKLLNPDRSLQYSTYTFPRSWKDFFIPALRRTPFGKFAIGQRVLHRYLMADWDHSETRDVDWVLGAAMMIRKSFVDSYGGFDQRYFLYNEDMDLCMQARTNGYRVAYLAHAQMIHYLERLSAEKVWYRGLLTKHAWIHIQSWITFFWKWRNEMFNH